MGGVLSTDGGGTYPHTIAAAEPNDGVFPWLVDVSPTTQARVKVVEVESAEPSHVPGTGADFVVLTQWGIVGTVGHWGHVHQRRNRYQANLALSAAGGAWKITGFEVLDQERVSP